LKKRLENEDRLGRKRGPRSKVGASPKMSKYRRKTANARERMRMGEINVAYDRLKDTIPLPSVGVGKQKCEKLTKINLLHIAINYIRTLQDILDSGDADIDIVPEKLILNPFRDRRESGSSSGNPSIEDDVINNDDEEDDDIDKSASPDSGIQDDSEAEYPDWTELNSTLDIRSQIVESVQDSKMVAIKENTNKVDVLIKKTLPLTPSNNTNFKLHNYFTSSDNKVTKCKPVTLSTRCQQSDKIADIRHPVPLSQILVKQETCLLSSTHIPMEQDDLFNELNSSIDSFDGISDIDFCYDDPFTFRVF